MSSSDDARRHEINKCFSEGNKHFDLCNYDEAINCYTQAIDFDQDNPEPYYNRGICYGTLGNHTLAIKDFSKVIDLRPKHWGAYFNRASVFARTKDYDSALQDYSQAIFLKPDYVNAYIQRGITYWNKGKLNKAKNDFSKAIKIDSKNADAYISRAALHEGIGEKNLALQDLQTAIEVDPNNEIPYLRRGILFRNMGNHQDALKDFGEGIKRNPNSIEIYLQRGITYFKEKNNANALKDFTKIIKLNPSYVPAYKNRGIVYCEKKEYELALDNFNAAIHFTPEDPSLYYFRGLVYDELKNNDSALTNFSKAIELNPKYEKAYLQRGIIHGELEHNEAALKDFTKTLILNPSNFIARFNMGVINERMQNFEAAIIDFATIIKEDKNNARAYFNRGIAYGRMGNNQSALKDFTDAIKLNSNEAVFYYNRGIIYECIKKYNEAIIDFQRIISDHIWGKYAKIQLAGIYIEKSNYIKAAEYVDLDSPKTPASQYMLRLRIEIMRDIEDQVLKESIIEIMKAVERLYNDLKAVETDQYVYQYAPRETFLNLCQSKNFWLIPACYQNDPEEGIYLFRCLKNLFKDKHKRPKNAMDLCMEVLTTLEMEDRSSNKHIAFVRSLTGREDDLLMWDSNYGDGCNGVAIGLPIRKLIAPEKKNQATAPLKLDSSENRSSNDKVDSTKIILPSIPIGLDKLELFKVYYVSANEHQQLQIFQNIAKALCKTFKIINEQQKEEITEILRKVFLPISHLIKCKSYEHEEEYRLQFFAEVAENNPYYYKEPFLHLETAGFLFEDLHQIKIFFGPLFDPVERLKLQHRFSSEAHQHIPFLPSQAKYRRKS